MRRPSKDRPLTIYEGVWMAICHQIKHNVVLLDFNRYYLWHRQIASFESRTLRDSDIERFERGPPRRRWPRPRATHRVPLRKPQVILRCHR